MKTAEICLQKWFWWRNQFCFHILAVFVFQTSDTGNLIKREILERSSKNELADWEFDGRNPVGDFVKKEKLRDFSTLQALAFWAHQLSDAMNKIQILSRNISLQVTHTVDS